MNLPYFGAKLDAPGAWGTEVVRTVVDGHPCLVYAERRKSLGELLVDLARWQERTCLVRGPTRLSYQGLVSCALAHAVTLKRLDIGRGDRVLIIADNSIEWVVTILAAAARGATSVLGNAGWSAEEIKAAIDLTAPALVLLSPRVGDRVPSEAALLLDDFVDLTARADPSDTVELSASAEDDPALILFTSGTTGAAKGVVLSNRAVLANLHNLLLRTRRLPAELPENHQGTVSLMGLPLFHIGGLQSMLGALLSGGTVIFLEERFDPEHVLELIEREHVSFWGAVPTMVRRVLDSPAFSRHDTSSVRSLTITGSMVEPELMARARAAFPGASRRVGSVYGLTEAGGILTAASGEEIATRPGCVGRPLPVVELRIKDPDGRGVGEVLARTPSVMKGYWSTEHSLEIDDDGWLSTGDLGRVDADGYLYIVGRSKDIVIRGGENIAAAHVENFLSQHPSVAESAVVALPSDEFGEEVGAIVVPRLPHEFDLAELQEFMAEHLARFERPSRWWIRVAPLPTTDVGKVDKTPLKREWIASLQHTVDGVLRS